MKGNYAESKCELAVRTLDLFTKVYCIKDSEEELEFECDNCPFLLDERFCLVKVFKNKYCPDYKDFGSMGDL